MARLALAHEWPADERWRAAAGPLPADPLAPAALDPTDPLALGVPPHADQAHGLRRLFAGRTLRCIPVVSNPHVVNGGAMLERLCTVFADQQLRTLVVDAGERARAPHELTPFDLREGIDVLSPEVSYLAARGLPLRFVDASGSTSGFLDALAEVAAETDVILLHAPAADLARLFARRVQERQASALRPIVLCDELGDSVTHAYAAIKLLATRAGLMAHDLLLSAAPDSGRALVVAERLARCADSFLGAVLHDCVCIDPDESATESPSLALQRLARGQLSCALAQRVSDLPAGPPGEPANRSALPAQAPAETPWRSSLR